MYCIRATIDGEESSFRQNPHTLYVLSYIHRHKPGLMFTGRMYKSRIVLIIEILDPECVLCYVIGVQNAVICT